jgi:hypothetical protein
MKTENFLIGKMGDFVNSVIDGTKGFYIVLKYRKKYI